MAKVDHFDRISKWGAPHKKWGAFFIGWGALFWIVIFYVN